MPELPEVETVRRGLAAGLVGRTLVRVDQRRADLRIPFPENFARRLEGRTVEAIGRRAKYLLWHFDDGSVLIGHLGMSGRFTVIPPGDAVAARTLPPGPHDHVIFDFHDGTRVVFTDIRRFGLMTLAPAGGLEDHPLLRDLGPEPLGNRFDGPTLAAALKGRSCAIKAALLDQKVVAGVGNIYASEALFRARLSPRRKARTVAGERAARLAAAIREILSEAIESGGSSLRDYAGTDGELGYFQHRFAVYGREGETCPGCDCGGAIRRIVQSNRSTFFCPARQR